MTVSAPHPFTTLLVDWGGVLTMPMGQATRQWCDREGVRHEDYWSVVRAWAEDSTSPMRQLERGRIPVSDFEEALAHSLSEHGYSLSPDGLLTQMMADLKPLVPEMFALLRQAKANGLTVVLLSNSWGEHYPDEIFAQPFDNWVISGRVGMCKPEPEIFEYAAKVAEANLKACILIDDLPANTHAAQELGMGAVLHRDPFDTAAQLRTLIPQGSWPELGSSGAAHE